MNKEKIIEAAAKEFVQKLHASIEKLPMDELTPELAERFSEGLRQSISSAAIVGYKTFIESYDVEEEALEVEGKKLRHKYPSKKTS
jgi:hypothetical protein